MGELNRASLIQNRCNDNSTKKFCEGYIDQCINQKIRKQGKQKNGDNTGYVLQPEVGKKITLKDFGTCTRIAPRFAKLVGRPAIPSGVNSKFDLTDVGGSKTLSTKTKEPCSEAEDKNACDAYVKMCEELDGKVMINGREVNLRSVRACKQQVKRFANAFGMPSATYESKPISDDEAQAVADSPPKVAAPEIPYLKRVQVIAEETGVKSMPKVSSAWSAKHTTAFDRVPQDLDLKQVLEVQLSKDGKSCLVTTVEGFNVYKHYIAGSDVWDMVAAFEGNKSMKLMDYAEFLDPLLQQLFRKGQEVKSKKDRPISKHFYYERRTERGGCLIEDVHLVTQGDENLRFGNVLDKMKGIRAKDINEMRVELFKSVKVLSMKPADVAEQSSWNADNIGYRDRLIP